MNDEYLEVNFTIADVLTAVCESVKDVLHRWWMRLGEWALAE